MPLGLHDLDRFEHSRARLQAIAYRLLGSASEAEDAVQDTFLLAGPPTASASTFPRPDKLARMTRQGSASQPRRTPPCERVVTRSRRPVSGIAPLSGSGGDPHALLRYFNQCISLGRPDGLVQFVTADDQPTRSVLTGTPATRHKEMVRRGAAWSVAHPTLRPPTFRRITAIPVRTPGPLTRS